MGGGVGQGGGQGGGPGRRARRGDGGAASESSVGATRSARSFDLPLGGGGVGGKGGRWGGALVPPFENWSDLAGDEGVWGGGGGH